MANYDKIRESGESGIDAELQEKLNAAIDEYKKPYNFGKNVIDNEDSSFDILNDLVRYLHTRFDENGWEKNIVFSKLPAWYRNAYLAWALDAEVQNGGLGQYFANSAGKYAKDTVSAFDIMGAEKLSAFLQSAIEINEECENLESENADEDEFFKYDNKIEVLDNQYYEGLDKKLFQFVDNYINQQMKISGETCFVVP